MVKIELGMKIEIILKTMQTEPWLLFNKYMVADSELFTVLNIQCFI